MANTAENPSKETGARERAEDGQADDPLAFHERELEDPRVEKTKARLRHALVELLDETTFDEITVTELCERADTTRITFYAHYGDKYSLAEELFGEMISKARMEFYQREDEDNAQMDVMTGYADLLDSILDLYYGSVDFFRHTTQSENPYLYSSLYRHLVDRVAHYIGNHGYMRSPRYSANQMAAFICGGIWSFIDESNAGEFPPELIRAQAHELLESVVGSAVPLSMPDDAAER